MTNDFVKKIHNAKKQASLWAYAAWTLPFLALGILIFEYFLGWHDLVSKTLTIIAVTFFSVSVFWWWWALNKIVILFEAMNKNETNFEEIKYELRETRKVLKENVGDR